MKEDEQYDLNRGVLMFVFMLLIAVWFFAVMCGCVYEKEIWVERTTVKAVEVKEYKLGSISKARIIWQDRQGIRYYEFTDWPTYYKEGYVSYLLLRK